MNILILSHERSLNKTEAFFSAYPNDNIFLVTDEEPKKEKTYTKQAYKTIIAKRFDINYIIKNLPKSVDAVWSVSENLLPLHSQLESYYEIENISPFAAEILSNKQLFDDYCRNIGLENNVPISLTPTFYKQLDKFKNLEIFTKPDIGTGSNVFFPNDQQNTPSIEYRRWNNKHHFLNYLKEKQIHNEFFDINKSGIYIEKFNYKACRIMMQEYFWSKEPSISPIGLIKDGKPNILFYVKNSKIKYGDVIDPFSNPIQSHSVSKNSDIVKERAAWIVTKDEIPDYVKTTIDNFLNTITSSLKIKNMFFSGPDFHINENRILAIDLNPRPGQFINILNNLNNGTIIKDALLGNKIKIEKKLLWGCAVLKPGIIKEVLDFSSIKEFLNSQNTDLLPGTIIPQFQNLQNKDFNINFNIVGTNEQDLFNDYIKINQILQRSIVYC